MPLAAQVVQTGHACLEAGRRFAQTGAPSGVLVVLSVPDQNRLFEAVGRINQQGIQAVVFFEPDGGLGYTAACTEPVSEDRRYLFRRYPLWHA